MTLTTASPSAPPADQFDRPEGADRADNASRVDNSNRAEMSHRAEATDRNDNARRIEELGRIILAYSDATERLQESHDELTRRVARLQEELGEKNRQLERRNRLAALGEMAAGIAHEIRNPLGAIRLYTSILRSDLQSSSGPLSVVEKIAGASTRMEAIVSQVLHFTREIRADCIDADLADVLREAAEQARLGHANQSAGVHVDAPDRSPACFDPRLIQQAVINLVSNALDAVADHGKVHVQLHRLSKGTKTHHVIRILDDGPGIAPVAIDKLFHPFFTTRDHGTGLGLSIVHRIVEAHDGTIEARNLSTGGACFEITI